MRWRVLAELAPLALGLPRFRKIRGRFCLPLLW
jgi:hypothetical protein